MRKCPAKHKLCTAVAMAGSLLAADVALSQAMLEEVVVTARKRAEDLQDVPMAVSAFNGQELQNFGIDEVTDVGRMTPNLVMNETSGLVGGAISIFMRGIGNDQGLEQGVGVYVDDVYLNRTSGAMMEVFDVERIEVLKGPQGNLYGRNTIGGAIKYITREPGDELEANIEVKAGTDELIRVKGAVSGPLIEDSLAGSLAFSYKERDGYQDNSFEGSDDPWDADTYALRGHLVWTPTDSLKFNLTGDYMEDDMLPPIPRRIYVDQETQGTTSLFLNTANLLFGPGTAAFDEPNDLRQPGDENFPLPGDEDDVSSAFTDGYDEFEIKQTTVALTVQYDINDQWLLKSVTAGRYLENNQPFDFDGSEQLWINTLRDGLDAEDLSQELQLNFEGDSIKAVMGLYYLDAEQTTDNNVTFQSARLQRVRNHYKDTYHDERTVESYSAYGNMDWDFADDWQLSLGARYTEDEKEETQKADVVIGWYAAASTPFTGALPLLIKPGQEEFVENHPLFSGWISPIGNTRFLETSGPEDTHAKETWDEFTPSIRLSHHLNDDTMIYTGVATGFKSGGFNRSGGKADVYDPETVTTYSVGMKSTLLDNTLRLNTEFFYNEYEDKQLGAIQLQPDGSLDQLISNVGEITQWGGEFEVSWVPPVDGLMINFNVGYLDYDVDEFKTADGDKSDITELGYSPEWTGQLRATYDLSLGDWGNMTIGSDVSYQDEMFTNSPIDTTNPIKTAQMADSYYLWNAVVAWRSNDEHWRVAVEGKNLNDEREIVNTFDIGVVATAGYTPPRTYAVSVGYTF